MSATTIPASTTTSTVAELGQHELEVTGPAVGHVSHDVRRLGELLAELDHADPRWRRVGPMTARAAAAIREAVGHPVEWDAATNAAPIVHQRDLAVAGRTLLGRDVTIVDTAAAVEAQWLCSQVAIALA